MLERKQAKTKKSFFSKRSKGRVYDRKTFEITTKGHSRLRKTEKTRDHTTTNDDEDEVKNSEDTTAADTISTIRDAEEVATILTRLGESYRHHNAKKRGGSIRANPRRTQRLRSSNNVNSTEGKRRSERLLNTAKPIRGNEQRKYKVNKITTPEITTPNRKQGGAQEEG